MDERAARWAARPIHAAFLRAVVFATPILGSIVFVHFASTLVPVPTSSFLLFASWWVGMSAAATVVLIAIDRVSRRLLPLVALYKLSLVFPDAAPSRFKLALRTNTVESLEDRIASARSDGANTTPVDAAERLLALVSELNEHDRLTRGHSDRVRAYAQMIGTELHLEVHELDLLNWAALLHDVGKLGVPKEILTKPGRPSEAEWRVLERHPQLGEALVAPLRAWLGEWADAVGQHHERWDGLGYPRQLSGESIALAGRIVAVADVFDVITSARSYKEPFGSVVARNEIASEAGTQFDPKVVRAFLNISLGRLRLVMGPLSWLAHAPILGRLPLTPALGTVSGSLATVAAAVTTGLAAPPAPVQAETTADASRPLPQLARMTHEDVGLTIGVGAARNGQTPNELRVTSPPAVGRTRVTAGRSIRYTPPPNFHGVVTVRYQACWSPRDCASGWVVVDVLAVNDPPVARDDTVATRPGTAVSIDVLGNDSDPDGDSLRIVSVSKPSAGRATVVSGRVRYVPPSGFAGVATFSYAVADGNGGRAKADVSVRVSRSAPPPPPPTQTQASGGGSAPPAAAQTPPPPPSAPPPAPPSTTSANRAPIARDDVISVPEGGSVTLAVLANDSDPDGDPLRLVSVGQPARGQAAKVGDRLQFVAPTNFVGRLRIPYTAADPRGAESVAYVEVNVLLVNLAPSFTAGANVSVSEDSGPQTVKGWASDISAGPSSEAGQTVSFDVSTDDGSLFAPGGKPEVAGNGTLTFMPAPNANGTAMVVARAKDDGGTANGGVDTSVARTFWITVLPVDDPPSFTRGPNQSAPEDAGAQAVSGWASAISPGPANEAGQSVSFSLSTTNPALFAAGGQPALSPTGTLTYRSAPNANGSATVTVVAKDDRGTANRGIDTSAPQKFTIAVTAVNDPPAFTAGANQTVAEDAGAQSVPGWATGISPGPPNESGQSVSLLVGTTNSALFSSPPQISPGGTLTYTSAPDANGTSTVTVRAKDDGGTANGGVDTSAPQMFTITVAPVNDPPVAVADSPTVAEDDTSGVTFDVLANDTDVDGDTLSVASYDASTIANGTLTANGGGSFTYVPDSGFIGTEAFTYVVSDGNGGTDTGTVTITVTPVQHPPVAGNDAYSTPQDTPLTVPAPGVLGNDGDQDGDAITLETTPVSAPADGSVTLDADGSFTYAPNAGFSGTDSFTYRIDDGTGRSADGVVKISVLSSPPTPTTFYFQRSGPSADVWDMTPSPAPPAAQLADFDGDGKPGLTIKDSDGKSTITEPQKEQWWTYPAPAPLALAGPVTLDVWSSTGIFGTLKGGTLYTYLYDCTAGGASCAIIASNTATANPWDTSLVDWGHRSITVGTVNHTVPAGNELRIKLLYHQGDLWVTMSTAYPSALTVTD
jgi:HD-GYP domain-containing protein (c-di-GMP phosphodiesterase class II)